MACQYTKEQILGQLMAMSPGTPNTLKWSSWYVVYDQPEGGNPPPPPADVNTMNIAQVAEALYQCYCLGNCP